RRRSGPLLPTVVHAGSWRPPLLVLRCTVIGASALRRRRIGITSPARSARKYCDNFSTFQGRTSGAQRLQPDPASQTGVRAGETVTIAPDAPIAVRKSR